MPACTQQQRRQCCNLLVPVGGDYQVKKKESQPPNSQNRIGMPSATFWTFVLQLAIVFVCLFVELLCRLDCFDEYCPPPPTLLLLPCWRLRQPQVLSPSFSFMHLLLLLWLTLLLLPHFYYASVGEEKTNQEENYPSVSRSNWKCTVLLGAPFSLSSAAQPRPRLQGCSKKHSQCITGRKFQVQVWLL